MRFVLMLAVLLMATVLTPVTVLAAFPIVL